ncbi:MAG TPA: HD domain-containing phosphohydrolase [Candidatus Acidoferrales bacterium]|jgi:HD-GYP domain-containing protein (c-di-GMP phosphodiesterase class II)|nr:HD domain-containing phosphohydrolase [Candidatus Acidoferrales bacterium]
MLLVSALPLGLYHFQVLRLSQEKLTDTESVQQTELTRAVGQEIQLFDINLYQQLISERQILALTGLLDHVNDPVRGPQVTRLLENFVASNPNILYLTAVGTDAKGAGAGNFRADQDPFVGKALQRAFSACLQSVVFRSEPLALGPQNRPAFVMAIPLEVGDQFSGMLAAVVSLDSILRRLEETSVRGRTVFVVDHSGRVIAHPDTRRFVPGTDLRSSYIVAQASGLPKDLRTTATVQHFSDIEQGHQTELIGTYSTIPDLAWTVIAQRSLEEAREDAGVTELNTEALTFVLGVIAVAVILGYLFAVGISTPIRALAASTRAISRGEFHERAPVRGAAEISELAQTFNNMAGDIENYIARLKQAAQENRELFLGSIRMLAAAIDEKDPYTRGHSDRVAKYSVLIGQQLGLSAEELDRLRISALLHDVGKIGVDDRVLKKPGALTQEEFQLMKQHPSKGANIMRPVAQLKDVLPGIELHHEHVDGKGYPYGLKGDEIPLMARIIAVSDTLDAMTTNRPYQSAREIDDALQVIHKVAGSKFDVKVVEALESVVQAGKLRTAPALVEV